MKDSASAALIDSVLKSEASATAQELGEIALDSVMSEGILKEIPIVSWLVRGHSVVTGIRDRIFLKKIAGFLREAAKISEKEREAFSKRLEEEPDLTEQSGESALLVIEKLSEVDKARLMGFAFRRFVQGAIDSVILHRIYSALEMMPLWQLTDLPEYYFGKNGFSLMGQGAATLYQQLGLLDIFYGEAKERMLVKFPVGSELLTFHQPLYRETLVGKRVAEVVRDYLAED